MNNETKKQEAIRLAYGEHWEKVKEFVDENGNYLLYDVEDKNFEDSNDLFFENIECIVKYNLTLTESAINKYQI